MKAKIDLEKFICSYVKWNNIQDALKDQGLKCWNGEIVEIQESEDERIRKTLLDTFSNFDADGTFWTNILQISKDNVLAWLEKQGEQKPKWTEEDENFFANICTIIDADRNFTESAKRKCKDWLKSLKKRMVEQQ